MLIRVLLALFALLLPGLARAELRVVATVPDLASLAQTVGGPGVKVTALSAATQDPHWVDARPNLALELSRADLLLAVGLDLEVGWLPVLQTGSRNPKVQVGAPGWLDCSRFVGVLQVPTTQVSRAMGDVHPGGNPHYLVDPRRVAAVAAGIAQRMGELDPANAGQYSQNLAGFLGQLGAAQARWEAALVPLRGAPVVAYHNSWPYLADWVGFNVVEHIEPRPGIPPTPVHVTHVVQTMAQTGAKLVIQESWFPTTTSELVAQKTGARLVVLPGAADFQAGETWIDNMDQLVRVLTGGS